MNGNFLILAASLLWGFGFFLRKEIVAFVDPILLTFFGSAIVALLSALIFRISPRKIWKIFWKNPLAHIGLALSGTVIATTLFGFALQKIDLSVAALLERTQPLFVLFLAAIFLGEKFSLRKIPWAILAIIASYFITTKNPFEISFSSTEVLGILAILGASFSWAVGTIFGKKLATKNNSAEIVFLRFGLSAIILSPFFLFREELNLPVFLDAKIILEIFLLAIFGSFIAYLLFYHGLKTVKANISNFLEMNTPVVAILLGFFFFDEKMSATQIIMIPLLLLSIFQISKKK